MGSGSDGGGLCTGDPLAFWLQGSLSPNSQKGTLRFASGPPRWARAFPVTSYRHGADSGGTRRHGHYRQGKITWTGISGPTSAAFLAKLEATGGEHPRLLARMPEEEVITLTDSIWVGDQSVPLGSSQKNGCLPGRPRLPSGCRHFHISRPSNRGGTPAHPAGAGCIGSRAAGHPM